MGLILRDYEAQSESLARVPTVSPINRMTGHADPFEVMENTAQVQNAAAAAVAALGWWLYGGELVRCWEL